MFKINIQRNSSYNFNKVNKYWKYYDTVVISLSELSNKRVQYRQIESVIHILFLFHSEKTSPISMDMRNAQLFYGICAPLESGLYIYIYEHWEHIYRKKNEVQIFSFCYINPHRNVISRNIAFGLLKEINKEPTLHT